MMLLLEIARSRGVLTFIPRRYRTLFHELLVFISWRAGDHERVKDNSSRPF